MRFLIVIFMVLAMGFPAWAGTFQNITNTILTYTMLNGQSGTAAPGHEVQTYEQLDAVDPASWQKIDEEPYVPLAVYDQKIDVAANATVSVDIDPKTSVVQLDNLGSVDVLVSLNTPDNPYPAMLIQANATNISDSLTLSNNRTIKTIYLKNLSTTTDTQVKVRVVP